MEKKMETTLTDWCTNRRQHDAGTGAVVFLESDGGSETQGILSCDQAVQ